MSVLVTGVGSKADSGRGEGICSDVGSTIGIGVGSIGGDDGGWESGPGSSSSNGVSFSFDTFPLRSFDRLFWNQTYFVEQ